MIESKEKPIITAAALAEAIAEAPQAWLVRKFNGDASYIDWEVSKKNLRELIYNELTGIRS